MPWGSCEVGSFLWILQEATKQICNVGRVTRKLASGSLLAKISPGGVQAFLKKGLAASEFARPPPGVRRAAR